MIASEEINSSLSGTAELKGVSHWQWHWYRATYSYCCYVTTAFNNHSFQVASGCHRNTKDVWTYCSISCVDTHLVREMKFTEHLQKLQQVQVWEGSLWDRSKSCVHHRPVKANDISYHRCAFLNVSYSGKCQYSARHLFSFLSCHINFTWG